jgi:hypothetical protein
VLKEGSVRYTELDGENNPAADGMALTPPYSFTLPAANVLITAEFESPDAIGYITSGKEALIRDDYDSAVAAFEAAYQEDPNNREAVFYSTLGKLASIAVDVKVRRLLQSIGFGNYPGNLNNLLTLGDSWDNYYTDDTYTTTGQRIGWLDSFSGILLPDYASPGGYYAFQNQQSITQDSKIDGNPSMATYLLVMFFNLMGSNIEDLNDVVDDALRYVLGDSFEAAAERAAALAYGDTFTAEQAVIEKLFLSDILEEGDPIGRAELENIFASFRVFKSGLEWIAACDLETDRFLFRLWSFNAVTYGTFFPIFPGLFDELNKPYVSPDKLKGDGTTRTDLINNIMAFIFQGVDNYFTEHPEESYRIPDMLPLLNHFLKDRSKARTMMDQSKTDMVKAIDALINVWDFYNSSSPNIPRSIKNKLNNYRRFKDGLTELKTAIESGGTFYYSNELPADGSVWDYTEVNAEYGINMGKLYTPGQLNPDKLIITEPGGRRPKFFGWGMDTAAVGTYIRAQTDFAGYEWIGFQLNLIPLKQIMVKGLVKDGRSLNDNEYVHTIFPDILLTRQNGEKLYEYYYQLYNYSVAKNR